MDRDQVIAEICDAAIGAVEPAAAVATHAQLQGDLLSVGSARYDLAAVGRVVLLGAGKPAAPMIRALVDLLGDRIDGGLVIVKHGHDEGQRSIGPVIIVGASHPLPDVAGTEAAGRIAALATDLRQDDLLIAVIGGGASSLLTLPAPGLELAHLQAVGSLLLDSGADIAEQNTVRKHLSAIKGGRLAQLAAPARTAGVLLSDVVGDRPDTIGSGPSAPDPTTFADAWSTIERYGLVDRIPGPVAAHLRRGVEGAIPDTPKPGDPLFDRVTNTVIGSNLHAAKAAVAAAQAQGFHAELDATPLTGEARLVGHAIGAQLADSIAGGALPKRPACFVRGGETTVTLNGSGLGGRNQELALAAAVALDGIPDVAVVALATDGQDGPTNAAGAIARGDTLSRARDLDLDAAAYLDRNDSYSFFDATDDLIRTGPTLTNVADLVLVFAF